MCPALKTRYLSHKVEHVVQALSLDLGERDLKIMLVQGGEMGLLYTCHCSRAGFIPDQSKLTETLAWT